MDDDRRRALRDLRFLGEAVLLRLGHTKLTSRVTYQLEPRFHKVVGSCILQPGRPAVIKVQYPLWLHLTEEEQHELVAHEHSHFAAWTEWGAEIDPHGIEWQSMMRCLGYLNVSGSKDLGHAARRHLAERGKTMAAPNKATLWVKDGYIFVKTPYVEAFIQELKADIPYGSRVFLKVEKVWRVDAAYHEDLLSVVKKHFGEPVILDPEPAQVVVVEGSGKDPFGAMLRVAPPEVLKKVYRMIAVEIHPDKGGKPEDMVTLNQAWDAVKKERGL